MPITIKETAGGQGYGNPLVGVPGPTTHIKLDVSGMTIDEVDVKGFLKPGVPLTSAGILVGAGPAFVYGVVMEAIDLGLAVIPPTNISLGADTTDPLIALPTSGLINRDVAEDNLGRAYSANELAGFVAAGSNFNLTTT